MTTTSYQAHVVGPSARSEAGRVTTCRERASRASRRAMTQNWTAADTEAARFVSGCIAAGALLGLVTAGVRPITAERHG